MPSVSSNLTFTGGERSAHLYALADALRDWPAFGRSMSAREAHYRRAKSIGIPFVWVQERRRYASLSIDLYPVAFELNADGRHDVREALIAVGIRAAQSSSRLFISFTDGPDYISITSLLREDAPLVLGLVIGTLIDLRARRPLRRDRIRRRLN